MCVSIRSSWYGWRGARDGALARAQRTAGPGTCYRAVTAVRSASRSDQGRGTVRARRRAPARRPARRARSADRRAAGRAAAPALGRRRWATPSGRAVPGARSQPGTVRSGLPGTGVIRAAGHRQDPLSRRPGPRRRSAPAAGRAYQTAKSGTGIGRASRQPCPWAQPICGRRHVASSSMPSATTSRPRCWPRSTIECDDRVVLAGAGQRPDEALVDLDLAHGQPLEVGQRRVAGAEVVDGQPDAEVPQLTEQDLGPRGLDHDAALGDLQRQQVPRHTVAGERAANLVDDVGVEQAAGRQVDGDPDVPAVRAPLRRTPSAHAPARAASAADQAAALGDRDELGRGDASPARGAASAPAPPPTSRCRPTAAPSAARAPGGPRSAARVPQLGDQHEAAGAGAG